MLTRYVGCSTFAAIYSFICFFILLKNDLVSELNWARQIARMHGLRQADLAKEIGISQSQVSKILAGRCERRTAAVDRLITHLHTIKQGPTSAQVKKHEPFLEALADVWNGSEAHAQAICTVIRSLAGIAKIPARSPGRHRQSST